MKRKFTLRKIRLNQGGYNSQGHYYGTGLPLYWSQSEDGIDMHFRAADRAAAKEHIRQVLARDLGPDDTIAFYN